MLMRNAPLVIIDDDPAELLAMKQILLDMEPTCHVHAFDNTALAIDFLRDSVSIPMAIFCRIDSPPVNGFEFRSAILGMEDSHARLAPFIFFARSSYTWDSLGQASELEVHAFFRKTGDDTELEDNLDAIFRLLVPGYGIDRS